MKLYYKQTLNVIVLYNDKYSYLNCLAPSELQKHETTTYIFIIPVHTQQLIPNTEHVNM